jgi:hypothetical protein
LPRVWTATWVLLVALGWASIVYAHGPTVAVAYRGIVPPTLTIRIGEKVHFRNTNSTGSPCTVVLDDGTATGPTLGRSEGWHHPFEEVGRFPFHVKEMPSVKGVIIVVAE